MVTTSLWCGSDLPITAFHGGIRKMGATATTLAWAETSRCLSEPVLLRPSLLVEARLTWIASIVVCTWLMVRLTGSLAVVLAILVAEVLQLSR